MTEASAAKGMDDTLADLEDLQHIKIIKKISDLVIKRRRIWFRSHLCALLDLLMRLCRLLVKAAVCCGFTSVLFSNSFSNEVPSSMPGMWVAPGSSRRVAKKAANSGELGGCKDDSKELSGSRELSSVVDPLDESYVSLQVRELFRISFESSSVLLDLSVGS